MTLLYIGISGITIAHIGDSRIYQFREGKIVYETDDHSLVRSWVKLGMITKEEAALHPKKNVITKAIMGAEHSVNAEVVFTTDILDNDFFFLCTDGVTDCFSNEELSIIFSSDKNAEYIKDMIVEHCSDKAKDNFSFYIIPIQSIQKITGYKQFLLSFFYSFA